MVLRILRELAWMIVELIAAVASLALIPALLLSMLFGSICLSAGAVIVLNGSENGHTLMYTGGIILITTLVLGWAIDYVYSFLR
jgi:hypothetical protein